MLYVKPSLPTTWHLFAFPGEVKSQFRPVRARQVALLIFSVEPACNKQKRNGLIGRLNIVNSSNFLLRLGENFFSRKINPRFFRCWSMYRRSIGIFWAPCLASKFEQSSCKSQKCFFLTSVWVSKNTDFYADFKTVEQIAKNYLKYGINKNLKEICSSYIFARNRKTFILIPFLIFFWNIL